MRPGFAQTRFPAQVLPHFTALAIRPVTLFSARSDFTALAIRIVMLFSARFHFTAMAKHKKSILSLE